MDALISYEDADIGRAGKCWGLGIECFVVFSLRALEAKRGRLGDAYSTD